MEDQAQDLRTIYTAGYGGRKLADLVAEVLKLDAILVDVRFSPFSRNPVFTKRSLQEALSARYYHLAAFGNANYRGTLGPDIVIQNFPQGLAWIDQTPQNLILLCACKDYATCHRQTLAAMLEATGRFKCVELGQPSDKEGSGPYVQATLPLPI